jgi:hypothetical protein
LVDDNFSVSDFSVDALKVTAGDILRRYVASRQQFGSLPSNISAMTVDLTRYIPAKSWSEFKQTGRVSVTIDPTEPALSHYSHVLATKVGLRIEDDKGQPNGLQVTITHEGRALIYDQAGQAHTYTHVPIAIPFDVQEGKIVVDGTVASKEGDYDGISPYGPWTIQINFTDDGFLSRVSKIALVFDGKARARRL